MNDEINSPEAYWPKLMKEIATWEDIEEYKEAQITTVKELLAEAKEISDVLGEYSYTSKLKELEETDNE